MTEKQLRLLTYIRKIYSLTGHGPTFSEMKAHMSLKYNQSVRELLGSLNKNGYVKVEKGVSRGIIPVADKKAEAYQSHKQEFHFRETTFSPIMQNATSNFIITEININNRIIFPKGGDKSGTS